MELRGALLRDLSRAPLGHVQDVLLDPDTQDARWLNVALEDDRGSVLVPAVAASQFAPGELLVPYPADVVVQAVHPEGQALTEADAARLMRLYGFAR